MFQILFFVSLESSWQGGLQGLGSMMFGLAVQKLFNIERFLQWKLNCSWKVRRNWNVPLLFLERSWWAGFNGIYWVGFGFRMWENWFLSDFCPWNSNKFQKTRFWKEKSVEDVVTLGPMAQATLVMYEGMNKALMSTEKLGRWIYIYIYIYIYKIGGRVIIRTMGLRTY